MKSEIKLLHHGGAPQVALVRNEGNFYVAEGEITFSDGAKETVCGQSGSPHAEGCVLQAVKNMMANATSTIARRRHAGYATSIKLVGVQEYTCK
jgi:hypothetical protein